MALRCVFCLVMYRDIPSVGCFRVKKSDDPQTYESIPVAFTCPTRYDDMLAQEQGGMPPPPGAPAGGVWEGEPACGRNSLIVGLVLHCWCVVFCPIDTRPVSRYASAWCLAAKYCRRERETERERERERERETWRCSGGGSSDATVGECCRPYLWFVCSSMQGKTKDVYVRGITIHD